MQNHVFKRNTYSIVAMPSKVFFTSYTIIIRGMKRLADNSSKLLVNQRSERLTYPLDNVFNMFKESIKHKEDFLQKTYEYFNNPFLGENAFKQTVMKGMFPRFSTKKEDIVSVARQHKELSSKITFDNLTEKTDIRFFPEVKTASMFAETSSLITEIRMNSEKPNVSTVSVSKGNFYKDTRITLNVNNQDIFIERDIKAGNNMTKPFSGLLAEIPYNERGELYTITNEGYSLEHLQKNRLEQLATYKKDLSDDIHVKYKEYFDRIENINKTEMDIFKKNILIQEELFYMLSIKELKINPSFYYAITIKEGLLLNKNFHTRLSPYINDRIFDNTKEFHKFMTVAI
jgi:hypothetical protein